MTRLGHVLLPVRFKIDETRFKLQDLSKFVRLFLIALFPGNVSCSVVIFYSFLTFDGVWQVEGYTQISVKWHFKKSDK